MPITAMDYDKTPSEQRVTIWLGSGDGPLGIDNVATPTATAINGGGGSGILNASPSISWSDMDFGMEASETETEPSLADISTYEDFGASNYGGSMSFFTPADYDDNSNLHSLVYDLTDIPGANLDIIKRIDGDTRTTAPAEDGDFVSVYRVDISSESNPFNIGESVRRTVGFNSQGDFSHYTIVGEHDITAVTPDSFAVGDKGRIRGVVQDRDYTNALVFISSNPDVIQTTSGGFYEVTGEGSAIVTIRDDEAGTSTTVEVEVGNP